MRTGKGNTSETFPPRACPYKAMFASRGMEGEMGENESTTLYVYI